MGIKGLISHCKKNINEANRKNFEEEIPPGAALVVDGIAYVSFILDVMAYRCRQIARSVPSYFFFSYELYFSLITEDINYMTDACSYHLIFYFDGKKRQLKRHTITARRADTNQKWNGLNSFCAGRMKKINGHDFPWPAQVVKAMIHHLSHTLRQQVVTTTGEADQPMAKHSSALRTQPLRPVYCYTNDSDFMVMKDCSMVEMGTLSMFSSTDGSIITANTGGDNNTMNTKKVVNVYTRQNISDLLGLTHPDLLVEFSILAGNDFSGHVQPKVLFTLGMDSDSGSDTGSGTGFDSSKVNDTRLSLSENGRLSEKYSRIVHWLNECYARNMAKVDTADDNDKCAVILRSEAKNFTSIINFCREFYQLGNISMWPFDPLDNVLYPLQLTTSMTTDISEASVGLNRAVSCPWRALEFLYSKVQSGTGKASGGKPTGGMYAAAKNIKKIYGDGLASRVMADSSWFDLSSINIYALVIMLSCIEGGMKVTQQVNLERLRAKLSLVTSADAPRDVDLIVKSMDKIMTVLRNSHTVLMRPTDISWSDLVACNFYEQVVTNLDSFLTDTGGNARTGVDASLPPREHYINGKYFYLICAWLRSSGGFSCANRGTKNGGVKNKVDSATESMSNMNLTGDKTSNSDSDMLKTNKRSEGLLASTSTPKKILDRSKQPRIVPAQIALKSPSSNKKSKNTVKSPSPASTTQDKAKSTANDTSASAQLPIDAYEEQILSQIENNRVSIIHGETGTVCGFVNSIQYVCSSIRMF